jgi:glycosyltransferase involved in cell wall biosynthesis
MVAVNISAVVCTHNRAFYLDKAIRSLLRQTLDASKFEIIVVDNASTDDTKRVVIGHKETAENLRYIHEPELGLSHARNTGFREASGRFVAYLDDDAVASEDWLKAALEAFDAGGPQVGCVGGRVDPIWEAPQPSWLPEELISYLTVLDLSAEPRFIEQSELIVGANMAFPRTCLGKAGGFRPCLGRTGKQLQSNDELALRRTIENQGFLTYYQPKMRVSHHILSERLCKTWFIRRLFWQGVSDIAGEDLLKEYSRDFLQASRSLVASVYGWTKSLVFNDSQQQRFLRVCNLSRAVGQLWAVLFCNTDI